MGVIGAADPGRRLPEVHVAAAEQRGRRTPCRPPAWCSSSAWPPTSSAPCSPGWASADLMTSTLLSLPVPALRDAPDHHGPDLPAGLALRVAGHHLPVPAHLHAGGRGAEVRPGLVRHPGRGEPPDRLPLAAGGHVGVLPQGRGARLGARGPSTGAWRSSWSCRSSPCSCSCFFPRSPSGSRAGCSGRPGSFRKHKERDDGEASSRFSFRRSGALGPGRLLSGESFSRTTRRSRSGIHCMSSDALIRLHRDVLHTESVAGAVPTHT